MSLPSGYEERFDELAAIARSELAPVADRTEPYRVDRELIGALASSGALPAIFPSAYGGTGSGEATAVELSIVREAVARHAPIAETALALQGLGTYPILQAGDEEAKLRWLPAVATGEAAAAFALTEARGGSDVAAIELLAERDGDGYRLDGEKKWISNAPDADLYTVFARTTPDAGHRGLTAFVVPRDSDGLSGEALRVTSRNPIGSLAFDSVHVAAENVLGEPDRGFAIAMRTLDLFRASVGASAVGIAAAALEAGLAHSASRQAFGRTLSQFQAVSHGLAEAATRIEAARLLVYDAAERHDRGESATGWRSSMAKLHATEVAQFAVDVAIQAHGALGVEEGHPLELQNRLVREARIYEGPSEIQREIISRALYKRTTSSEGG